jgi:FAD/FMN-containing dehydrogenase
MDNQMDDVLMPTWFTEIWIPYTEAGGEVPKAIAALRKLFAADGSDAGAYAATGPFCIELYAAGGSTRFCLNPAFGDKNVLRVDVFWFALNAGNPLDQFYPAFWRAFDEAGLEYRLHWGKFLPRPEQLARATLTARYPQWDMFTRWRSHADPKDVFLTDYWRGQLGL